MQKAMAPLQRQAAAAAYTPSAHPEASFWQQFTATLKRNILRKRRTMKHTLTVSDGGVVKFERNKVRLNRVAAEMAHSTMYSLYCKISQND